MAWEKHSGEKFGKYALVGGKFTASEDFDNAGITVQADLGGSRNVWVCMDSDRTTATSAFIPFEDLPEMAEILRDIYEELSKRPDRGLIGVRIEAEDLDGLAEALKAAYAYHRERRA